MANKSGVVGSTRWAVMRRDHYTCQRCGLQGWEHRNSSGSVTFPTQEAGVNLSIDHVIPRARGGRSDDLRNLRVLCTRCNSKKGTHVIAMLD